MTSGGYTKEEAWNLQEQAQREAVIAEARSWIGTPYHHAARVKGHGVDCGKIIIAVYSACGVFHDFEPAPYSKQFHLHKQEEWYERLVSERAAPVETPSPGDIAVYRIGRVFSHGAVVVNFDGTHARIIHAYARAKFVVEQDTRGTEIAQFKVKYFSPWRK